MCMVSNIGDQWGGQFPQQWPKVDTSTPSYTFVSGVSQAEFDALKREVEELKKLLVAAKKFDAATGQPHCEMDAKVALIKQVAALVGVDLGDVFETAKPKQKRGKKAA